MRHPTISCMLTLPRLYRYMCNLLRLTDTCSLLVNSGRLFVFGGKFPNVDICKTEAVGSAADGCHMFISSPGI